MLAIAILFGLISCGTESSPKSDVKAPSINIYQASANDLPAGTGEYNFGNVDKSSTSGEVIFTIENKGNVALELTAAITVSNMTNFAVTQPGQTTLAAGESTTFTIEFDPANTEVEKTGIVTVANNDDKKNPYEFTVKGTGYVPAPRIEIKQGGIALSNNGSALDFGSVIKGESATALTFTVKNIGELDLSLGGITLNGTGKTDYTLDSTGMSANLTPGSETTFTVNFTPDAATSAGVKTANVSLVNGDATKTPFVVNFTASATNGPEPEIVVSLEGVTFESGDTGKNFGTVLTNATATATFKIENKGQASLSISSVALSGTNADQFSVSTSGMATTLAVDANTTFSVTFEPASAGTKNGTITINNNDSDEGAFAFGLTGVGEVPVPAITVKKGATVLTNGAQGHSYGNVAVGASGTVVTFTIENSGTANLSVGTITLSGTNNGEFVVSQAGKSSLTPGETTTFTANFSPNTIAGAKAATIEIDNGDSTKNPFEIDIVGTATGSPEIALEKDAVNINTGAQGNNFGTVLIGQSSSSATFTIKNTGTDNLTLGTITKSGTGAADFTVTQAGSSSVAPGSSTTFTVTFSPLEGGSRTATISIPNNDSNENPFTFTVVGVAKAEWTIMIHMNGDSNLVIAALYDIYELRKADLKDKAINVVVLADGTGFNTSTGELTGQPMGTSLFKVDYQTREDVGGEMLAKITALTAIINGVSFYPGVSNAEVNMLSQTTISDFVTVSQTQYPANNYSVIYWSHGDGWRSSSATNGTATPSTTVKTPLSTISKDQLISQNGFVTKKYFPTRGINEDVDSGSTSLENKKLAQALTGKDISVVVFDACLQGSLETLWAFKKYTSTQYIVASPDFTPGAGNNYTNFLNTFKATSLTALDFIDAQISAFTTEYASYMDPALKPSLMAYNLANLDTTMLISFFSWINSNVADKANYESAMVDKYMEYIFYFTPGTNPGLTTDAQTLGVDNDKAFVWTHKNLYNYLVTTTYTNKAAVQTMLDSVFVKGWKQYKAADYKGLALVATYGAYLVLDAGGVDMWYIDQMLTGFTLSPTVYSNIDMSVDTIWDENLYNNWYWVVDRRS